MSLRFIRKHASFISLLLIIGIFTLIFLLVGPKGLIDFIGVRNSYLLVFLVGAFGGVSSLTASSFVLTVVTLASGGANPLILGITGGFGITIGDTLFYFLGLKGRETLTGGVRKVTNRFSAWIQKQPGWLIPFVVFFYASFAPLPNDVLTVSLGLCKCTSRKILIPLLLGNILFTTMIAWISATAFLA